MFRIPVIWSHNVRNGSSLNKKIRAFSKRVFLWYFLFLCLSLSSRQQPQQQNTTCCFGATSAATTSTTATAITTTAAAAVTIDFVWNRKRQLLSRQKTFVTVRSTHRKKSAPFCFRSVTPKTETGPFSSNSVLIWSSKARAWIKAHIYQNQ